MTDYVERDPTIVSLLNGAPVTPPASIALGEFAIVLVWRDGDLGATVEIYHEEDDEDDEPYSVEVSTFRLTEQGWMRLSSGGSDWPVGYGERPGLGRPAFTGFGLTLPDDRVLCPGVAPQGVEAVRYSDGQSTTEHAVDLVTGAFVVAVSSWWPDDAALSDARP